MSESGMTLNVLWLWPDILNLHGNRGNAMAITRVAKLYDIETNITRVTRLSDSFDLTSADIVLLGTGELAVMPDISGALSKHASALKDYTESGGVIFAVGTTASAIGVHTTRVDDSHIYGVGLLDIECKERNVVLGDDLIFRIDDSVGAGMPVYGIQIQMIDIKLGEGQTPLGNLTYGYGNNGTGTEGAINNGIVFTNALGPVLIKNPWLALELIKKASLRKAPNMDPNTFKFDPSLFEIEIASAKAIQMFNDKKEKPR